MNRSVRSDALGLPNKVAISLAIFLYIFSVVFFSYQEGWTLIAKAFAMFLVVTFLLLAIINAWGLIFPLELKLLGLWFIWACFSSILGGHLSLSIGKILTLLQIYGLSFFLFQLIVRVRSVNLICFICVFSLIIVVGYTYLAGGSLVTPEGRVFGTLSNPNIFGVVLLFGLAFCLHLFMSYPNLLFKAFFFTVATSFLYMILQTGSRKALLGSVMIFGLYGLAYYRGYLRGRPVRLAAFISFSAIAISALLLAIYNSEHFDRVERLFVAVESGSSRSAGESELGRIDLYQTGLEKISQRPVFGHGIDSFRALEGSNSLGMQVGTYSHSNYIEVAIGTGIIGLVIYYSVYMTALGRYLNLGRRSPAKQSETARSAQAIAVPLIFLQLAFDFALVTYYEKAFWVMITILLAFSYLFTAEQKRELKKQDWRKAELQKVHARNLEN